MSGTCDSWRAFPEILVEARGFSPAVKAPTSMGFSPGQLVAAFSQGRETTKRFWLVLVLSLPRIVPPLSCAKPCANICAMNQSDADRQFMRAAFDQATESYNQGGLPIGAVMAENGAVIATGHNRRVQDGDPIAHGEMDCFRNAGRRLRYDSVTLYTTLSPCMMCSGTILQFGVKRVVVGENRNFPGNIDFLQSRGVEVLLVDDPYCVALMRRFIQEHPDLWDEDIAGR